MFGVYVIVGGYSVFFVVKEFLEYSEGVIDCILKGEGEVVIDKFLDMVCDDCVVVNDILGVVILEGEGLVFVFVESFEMYWLVCDLFCKRNKYFIGLFDLVVFIEFLCGCFWDCNFCSVWIFYGCSYWMVSFEVVVDELKVIK